METLIKNSIDHIISSDIFFEDKNKLKIATDVLNKNKFIILSWMIWVWKINFIKYLLIQTSTINSFFYINPEFDINNIITSSETLNQTFELYRKKYNDPKIIILENINNIPWVKQFITKIHKNSNYKLIIIWNSIKITWIKELEITTNNYSYIQESNIQNSSLKDSFMKNSKLSEVINYWKINDVLNISNLNQKKRYLNLLNNNIILKDIVWWFSVKNVDLLNSMITYLTNINTSLSLRELHKQLKIKKINISLITTIDYINYLLSSKMISCSYTYDLKTKKEITSRAKYYFSDNWIRNYNWRFNLNRNILIENLIFSDLISLWYKVHNWKNWTFDFTFYWVKDAEKIFIHISKETDKNELKKEVRRLLKTPWDETKYIIINDAQIENMKIKKFAYENVKILILEDLLKELK